MRELGTSSDLMVDYGLGRHTPRRGIEPVVSPGTTRERLEETCWRYSIETLHAFGSRSEEVRELVAGRNRFLSSGVSDVDLGIKLGPAGPPFRPVSYPQDAIAVRVLA